MWRGCRTLLAALVLTPGFGAAQSGMPVLRPEDYPGLEVRQTEFFAGMALYGHINGGADLYREYGFEQLAVQELRLDGETHYCEVYRMSDPGAAFGIFSVSRGICTPADSLPPASCYSPQVVQWAQDRYFVRIAGASGSEAAGAGGLRLARSLSGKIPDTAWTMPPVAMAAGATERTLILVRGVLGMQNGFDRWSPLVEGMERFEATIVSREDSTGQFAVGEFRFAADADRDRLVSSLSGGATEIRRLKKSGARLLLMESDTPADSLWSRLVRIP